MTKRQKAELLIIRIHGQGARARLHRGQHILMSQHSALGHASGARGIDQHRGIFRFGLCDLGLERTRDLGLIGLPHGNQIFDEDAFLLL